MYLLKIKTNYSNQLEQKESMLVISKHDNHTTPWPNLQKFKKIQNQFCKISMEKSLKKLNFSLS